MRFLAILKTLYLIDEIPPWQDSDYADVGKRSKFIAADTGMMASVLNWNIDEVALDGDRSGKIVESWAYNQLGRLCPSCMVQGQHRQAAAIHRHCAVHGGTHSSFRQEPLCSPHGDTLHIAANRPLLGGRHGRRRLLKTRHQRHLRHAAACPSADFISYQRCRECHHFNARSRDLSPHGS